ncbi:8-amino-7-oxononanoate synthase [Rhodococcus rhodnii]|uniref:8-amino-7-oxononanoate synthase n=2 Tax=Rhodococcus rhodnii TaxID=38312 RepID=R7WTL8_9NOCA|nr:8-amino-7-oxononanoate synthase [Rhodococcus rhodnii]EOM78597.1 8-amino-7-oxononanoate synthase [Rhodococcus rhodnii LMG 5362]TXG91378.1 8-amino-7-oxononanoate synthase [Rhodococcus rhodnii]
MPLPSAFAHWFDGVESTRRAAGLRRELSPRPADSPLLDLASNDYLGLSRHPEVVAGAVAAARLWGTGATGSRLVTGSTADHHALEDDLAAFTGAESGLVFSSGYTANLAVVAALAGRGTLVVSDAGVHASLVDACRLSKARVEIVPHADVAAVSAVLRSRSEERALVLTDSVFSADGDLAPLRELHAVTSRHGALLVVDEAHGLGVRGDGGRGWVHECGLAGDPGVVVTATLSKSLAAQGGVVLAAERVRAHLIDNARTFVFDTALAPPAVGAARAALAVLRGDPTLPGAVLHRAREIAAFAGAPRPDSAVVSVILGDAARAKAAADACRDLGLAVGCFRPPSVPEGTARLRLTARASLTDGDIATVRDVLGRVLARSAA